LPINSDKSSATRSNEFFVGEAEVVAAIETG